MSTQNLNEIEYLRTFSLLSNSPHYADHESGLYVAYAGYVLPYHMFSTIFMWALCGPMIYHGVWKDQEDPTVVRELNTHDDTLALLSDDRIGHYISSNFKRSLAAMDQSDIEHMLVHMICQV